MVSNNSLWHKSTQLQWFQVLLRITNNPIKYQSFIFTLLYYQTVLFLTIQFRISQQSSIVPSIAYVSLTIQLNISHLFSHNVYYQTVLFLTIQFRHKSTKFNGSKHCYESLTIQLNNSHLFSHNYSYQTVLFLTIQFRISQQSSMVPSIAMNH